MARYIGIDIGGTKCAVTLGNEKAEVLSVEHGSLDEKLRSVTVTYRLDGRERRLTLKI